MSDRSICVVTGATRGLGRAVTIALVEAGYDVVAIARNTEELDELNGQCQGAGAVTTVATDLGDGASLDQLAKHLASLPKAPKALINNAANQTFKSVEDFSADEFSTIMQVNTVAPFALGVAVLPGMISAGGGVIVNIASDLAYRPLVQGSAYCASKAALVAWSQVMQEEQRGNGIKVAVVEPGWIATGDHAAARAKRGDMDASALATTVLSLLRLPNDIRVDRLVIHPMNQGTWG